MADNNTDVERNGNVPDGTPFGIPRAPISTVEISSTAVTGDLMGEK